MVLISIKTLRYFRTLAVALIIVRAAQLLWSHNNLVSKLISACKFDQPFPTSAGNTTLGFQKIVYINLDHRYDYDDAMALQSLVSNITVTRQPGVNAADLKDAGLPPSSEHDNLKKTEQACYRAHANLWRQMIDENWSSVLVLEADAIWDIHVREMMRLMSKGLNELMRMYPNSSASIHGSEAYSPESLLATENDPYCVNNWDVLSLGQCLDFELNWEEYYIYDDPYGLKDGSFTYGDHVLYNQRVVRRSGGPVCLNAYAISRKGAEKMLLRGAIDLNVQVDWIMHQLTDERYLNVFSLERALFGQWEYIDGIGADVFNSEIDTYDSKEIDENAQDIWDKVHRTFNVWKMKERYFEQAPVVLQVPALSALGPFLFGEVAKEE